MWTRAELKTRAKSNLKRYFGPAMFVSFIANLFSSRGNGGSSGRTATGINTGVGVSGEILNEIPIQGGEHIEELYEDLLAGVPGAFESLMEAVDKVIDPAVIGVIASIVVVAIVVGFVLSTFVAPLFLVGKNRYYMESRAFGVSAGIDTLIWGFKHSYFNIVWTMFLKNLIIGLGTMCFIIPGIYFSYSYYMVPYILAENPDMKAGDVLRMSKDMMEGEKLNTFVLELSFWGWWILGGLMCGVGGVLIQPYYDATFAELYAVLRAPFDRYLNGFGSGNNDFGYQQSSFRNGGYEDVTQQHVPGPERNEFEGAGEEPSDHRHAESFGSTDYVYHQRTETVDDSKVEPVAPQSSEVSRPETEAVSSDKKVHGYYLNGVFYPYTEEELRELEENKHKN